MSARSSQATISLISRHVGFGTICINYQSLPLFSFIPGFVNVRPSLFLNDQLKQLRFLLGEWKGRAEDQFGEKGVIESTYVFTQDPSEEFIAETDESWKEGKLVNRSVAYLMFDQNIGKSVRKNVFSYGWINNEVGEWKDDKLVFDVVSIDGEPDSFKGVKWRSFIRKYSEDEIGAGWELSKKGGPFQPYGETKARRTR